MPQPIDIGFVDGIHTYEWVTEQYAILKQKVAAGEPSCSLTTSILLPDACASAGDDIAAGKDVIAACELNNHVGVVELGYRLIRVTNRTGSVAALRRQ